MGKERRGGEERKSRNEDFIVCKLKGKEYECVCAGVCACVCAGLSYVPVIIDILTFAMSVNKTP